VFKPNRKEAESVIGARIKQQDDVIKTGQLLLKKLHAKNVLLTLGENGMSLFESDGSVSHVPTRARNVQDVSGAGDTVIATLTMALAAGSSIKEATTLANFAGGIVCGYVGIVPIEKPELKSFVLQHSNHHSRTTTGTS
jgi:rfaE bifunctional protein kinase chain/domain